MGELEFDGCEVELGVVYYFVVFGVFVVRYGVNVGILLGGEVVVFWGVFCEVCGVEDVVDGFVYDERFG